MSPAGPHAPEIGRKRNDRQQEESTRNLKPQDAANATERAKEAADALGDAPLDLAGSLAGIPHSSLHLRARLADTGRALPGLNGLPGGSRHLTHDAFASHFADNTQPCTQHATNGERSHSVYDGSSDAW